MKIVFFGSSGYSIEVLKELRFLEYKSLHVVTRSDKPKGRGMKTTPTGVKVFAQRYGIPVYTPHDLRSSEFLDEMRAINPDLFLIASYGRILPQELLEIPRLPICLHPSLLPEYRGAAPVNWSLINGDEKTGVTLFKVVEKMDAGDILFQEEINIAPEDDSFRLFEKVYTTTKHILETALPLIKVGKLTYTSQDESRVTLAPKIEKDMARIDWSDPAQKIRNLTRGLSSHGCTWAMFRGKRVKFWKVDSAGLYCQRDSRCTLTDISKGVPGEIVYIDKHHLKISAGEEVFVPLVIQPEGKHKMDITDFISGFRPHEGEMFE